MSGKKKSRILINQNDLKDTGNYTETSKKAIYCGANGINLLRGSVCRQSWLIPKDDDEFVQAIPKIKKKRSKDHWRYDEKPDDTVLLETEKGVIIDD